ncbi:MAG: hypothetical protein JXN62_00050 [Bacteroidales bacterium]|nr:hypothetical protein [Bacteroidales bacterium]
MIRKFFILSYFFSLYILLPSTSAAQENISQKSPYIEEDQISDDESPHSFFAGAGYGNNMIYMGSNVSQDKPFISGSLTYGYKNEFFASVSTSHLSAFEPFISFSALSLSYYHDVNSWFDISTGLSRYQVNNDLRDTLFNSFFYGYLTLGFDWNILYTTISAGGLFSEFNSAYFSLRNSRYFTTPEFFNGKAFVSFDPYVNLLFGTLTKTITSDGTTIGVSTPFKPGKPSGGSGSGTGTTTNFFSLMEIDLGLPVGFNIGKLTLEAEPGYVFPAYSVYSIESPKGFVLLFNIFYRIF